MTLAKLVERGGLTYDLTLQECLPSAPEHYAPITLRMLAGHLGGIRHYDYRKMQQEFLSSAHCSNHAEGLAYFQGDPLKNDPGGAYLYSTYGYTVLGAALEHAEERPLIESMRKYVLKPAGMKHTFSEHHESLGGMLAVPYASYQGKDMIAPPVDNSCKLAGGGLVSTAEDLARFLGAVANHRIVTATTFDDMLVVQKTAAGKQTGVGIGWRVDKDAKGRVYVHHGGSALGGRAFVLLYPEQRVGVAMCMNLSSQRVRFGKQLALDVADAFLDRN